MKRPLTILCTPLPAGSSKELEGWRCAFEAVLEPWLDDRQLAHVRRFGRSPNGQAKAGETQHDVLRAALSRLFARAQLVTYTAQQATAVDSTLAGPLPQLGMDTQGRPLFPGWHAAFSHSGEAAFCALCTAPTDTVVPPHALDAESLFSPPPAPNAFAPAELARREAGFSQQGINREALRRWTIKEALLKASGLGLGMDPARVATGILGQRAGIWRGPMGVFYWRSLPCPGHWLSVAQQVSAQTDFRPDFLRPRVLRQNPTSLLRTISALCPRG